MALPFGTLSVLSGAGVMREPMRRVWYKEESPEVPHREQGVTAWLPRQYLGAWLVAHKRWSSVSESQCRLSRRSPHSSPKTGQGCHSREACSSHPGPRPQQNTWAGSPSRNREFAPVNAICIGYRKFLDFGRVLVVICSYIQVRKTIMPFSRSTHHCLNV